MLKYQTKLTTQATYYKLLTPTMYGLLHGNCILFSYDYSVDSNVRVYKYNIWQALAIQLGD